MMSPRQPMMSPRQLWRGRDPIRSRLTSCWDDRMNTDRDFTFYLLLLHQQSFSYDVSSSASVRRGSSGTPLSFSLSAYEALNIPYTAWPKRSLARFYKANRVWPPIEKLLHYLSAGNNFLGCHVERRILYLWKRRYSV